MTAISAGSCLCGEVRFEIVGSFDSFFLCHCSRCRKGTGSAHGANLFAARATLAWLSGAERVATYQVPDSRHARSFCTNCGAALPMLQLDGALLVVPAGTLDGPVPIRPSAHLCWDSRADWDEGLDAVARLGGLPG